MSDTVVVMKDGVIQQIGTPEDIYNEPINPFVADFIGESNIIGGTMIRDLLVEFEGVQFPCVDKGFGENNPVDVVVRPEDIKIREPEEGMLCGTVESVTFKGVHYEMMVRTKGYLWKIHSITYKDVGTEIGMKIIPEYIHIMKKEAGTVN